MVDLQITGGQELARVAARLKALGEKDLRRMLLAALQRGTRPARPAVRASALATLPKRGGLAAVVAGSQISIRTRTTGATVGVRIVAQSNIGIDTMDAGQVRHPLYGNRKFWFAEAVAPGWYTRPLELLAPGVRQQLVGVIGEIDRQLGD